MGAVGLESKEVVCYRLSTEIILKALIFPS